MKLSSAISWAVGAQYVVFILQFSASVYLGRYFITPSDLGAFSTAVAAAAIATCFRDFGLVRYLVGLRRMTHADLLNAWRISTVLALVAAGLCYVIASPLGNFLHMPLVPSLIHIIALAPLFAPLSLGPVVLLQRRMNFRAIALADFGAVLANVSTSVCLAHQGFGAEALAWGTCAQEATRAMVAQCLIGGFWPRRGRRGGPSQILHFGRASTFMDSLWLVANKVPDLVIGQSLGQVAVGLFSRAQGLSALLRQLMSQAASPTLYAAFAKARAQGAPLAPLYEQTTASYCALAWPALAGLAILAEPVILLLYGDKWLAAAPVLRWIALSQLFYIALPLHTELPMMTGQIRSTMWRSACDSILYVVLASSGALFSITAAAVMRFLFGFVWIGIHGPQVSTTLGLNWKRMAHVYLSAALASMAAVAPAGLGIVAWGAAMSFPLLIALVLAGVGAWMAALMMLHHPLAQFIRRPRTRAAGQGQTNAV